MVPTHFIPGFEEQLVGAKAGDHVEVKVTFPEEYQAKELAGKEAVFQCELRRSKQKSFRNLMMILQKMFLSLIHLQSTKRTLKKPEDKKAEDARRAKEDAAVDKVIENAQMDIPEAMLKTQTRQMLDDFAEECSLRDFHGSVLPVHRQTADKMMEDMKPQALKRIQTRLVLEKSRRGREHPANRGRSK